MEIDLDSEFEKARKRAVYRGTDEFWETDLLPTGIAAVDWALGGGFGYGRVSEIYGGYSSGKTLLLYYALAQNQQKISNKGKPGKSFLFESEGAFSPEVFTSVGGDPSTLTVIPANTVEEVFGETLSILEIMQKVKDSGDDISVAVGWDSIAATTTRHAMEVGLDKADMTKAKQISQGVALVATQAKSTKVAFIATNQTRDAIGNMDSKTLTPGGKGYPFIASSRLELRFDGGSKTSEIKADDGEVIGKRTRGAVDKNKITGITRIPFVLPIYNVNIKIGHTHPIYGTPLKPGLHMEEALYELYCEDGPFWLPGKKKVITSKGAWQSIEATTVLAETNEPIKFMRKEWLSILESHPILWDLWNQDFVKDD